MLYLLVYYIFEVCLLPRTSSYKYVQSQTQCTEEQQRTKTTSCYDSRKTSPLVGSPVLPRSRTQAPSNHQQSPALSHRTCNHSTGLRDCQLRKIGYHLSVFWTFSDNYMRLIFSIFPRKRSKLLENQESEIFKMNSKNFMSPIWYH